MKFTGIKTPMKYKNDDTSERLNRVSWKGSANALSSNVRFLGGRRDLTVANAMRSNPRIKNAQIRIVHAKPTFGMSCAVMIGKITPPKPDPAACIPNAAPRFFMNHVTDELVAVLKMQFRPRGETIP